MARIDRIGSSINRLCLQVLARVPPAGYQTCIHLLVLATLIVLSAAHARHVASFGPERCS